MALFDIGGLAFRPFIDSKAEFVTENGSAVVDASVLPYAPRGEMPGGVTGDAYSVCFLAESWTPETPFPQKGDVCLVGSKQTRTVVVQAFRVGDLLHVVAAANPASFR